MVVGVRGTVVGALAAAALLGCAGGGDPATGTGTAATGPDAPIVQLGAPEGTNRVLTPAEAAAITAPPHTEADVAFVHGMLAHHEQALVMTALVPERTSRTDIPLLAERMDVSQRDEIGQLERWLEERGETRGGDHLDHAAHGNGPGAAGALMPGMLTEGELAALTAARGGEFDRLFLESMIRHHVGALTMIDTLLTGGAGGQEPQVFQLAQHMDADQRVEISRMRSLLAEMTDG